MRLLGIVVALLAVALVAFMAMFPSVTVRYRLTLRAEVDGEPKTGSGVIEVTYGKQPRFANARPLYYAVKGEAAVLDFGSRGALFALLKQSDDNRSGPETIVFRAFNFPGGVIPDPVDEGLRQFQRLSGKRDLSLSSLPLLVRFRDLHDPATVEKVDPLDLGNTFGAGVKLVSAELEIVPAGVWPLNSFGITGEQITTGIEKRLSWLPGYYDLMLDGQRNETISSQLRFANSLSSGAFKAGR